MLFHAFRVVYTVKEFDSHAKHGQSFKKKNWTYNRVFLSQKSQFRIRTSFWVFFDRCSWWRKRRWNSLYGHFSRKNAPVHASNQSESSQSTRFNRQIPRSGRMSLKKCVFGCEGKITLFSFPKEPSVTWTVDIVCFSGAAMEFLKCFVDERFINKA